MHPTHGYLNQQAQSRLMTQISGINGGGGGDPKPASLDREPIVDPVTLLLGGGTTGVCTVPD